MKKDITELYSFIDDFCRHTKYFYYIYTSNIFAILGLRALFFCLADIVERFKYIKYSLAIILILIGTKIFVAHFVEIPKVIPLIATLILIILGILVSVVKDRNALTRKR